MRKMEMIFCPQGVVGNAKVTENIAGSCVMTIEL